MPSPAAAVGALVLSAGLLVHLPTASAASTASLSGELARVMADSRVQRADSGAVVLDASSGATVYARHGDGRLIPASNAKIVTAAAAMHTLGPDYRFSTEVIRRTEVDGGRLVGRLYLKGYGDPTLRQSDLSDLAAKVRTAGIRTVTGDLVADAGFFDAKLYNSGWSTSYADAYYAAPVSGLTLAPNADFDSGTVLINYTAGSRGSKAKISSTPSGAMTYLQVRNRTSTTRRGSATTFSARRSYDSPTITVSGHVPQGRSGSWQISVERPDLYAAAVFAHELAKAGVTLKGTVVAGPTPSAGAAVVATDRSMTLAKLLVPFLKLSNNLHAEALTKAMGAAREVPGSWSGGLAATRAYLASLGVESSGVTLVDGSGLSRKDRLTPEALATTLQKVQSEPWFDDFYDALPIAGNTSRLVGGTMRYRLNGTAAANNAHAKTGSLTGVTALSGYVRSAGGTRYVYSMISNYDGTSPRPIENTLVLTLARWDD